MSGVLSDQVVSEAEPRREACLELVERSKGLKKRGFVVRKCFTLLELIVVVLVVGIVVSFAIPGFLGAQRKAIDREARINLKLIQAAVKIHLREEGTNVTCSDNSDCNDELNLDLPPSTANGGNWTYAVQTTGGGPGFNATATGTKGSQGTWTIDEDDNKAS
ncbi:MAG: prepilin-type N-terminal cleavage/methylation domain-containing protein [Candidatus Omnitrophica bacterium]|nr:prepilin-type N-terminal cleavage/methylation domain-containing protein [Candidatus Omnitrophota bacterium]